MGIVIETVGVYRRKFDIRTRSFPGFSCFFVLFLQADRFPEESLIRLPGINTNIGS